MNVKQFSVRRYGGAGLIAVLCLATTSDAVFAATKVCAQPAESTAIHTASVQQELMVAGLSCRNLDLRYGDFKASLERYNAFQTAYLKELRVTDRNLLSFFRRVGKGDGGYHAYKTRAANNAQMRYIHDAVKFCEGAMRAFEQALGATKSTLASFVVGQPLNESAGYDDCAVRTASVTGVPVPRVKPALPVTTASVLPASSPVAGAATPVSATATTPPTQIAPLPATAPPAKAN